MPECMYMHLNAGAPWGQKDLGSTGTGDTDGGELPCMCWELDPGLLQEQWVLLNQANSPTPAFCNTLRNLCTNFQSECPVLLIFTAHRLASRVPVINFFVEQNAYISIVQILEVEKKKQFSEISRIPETT